MLDSSILKPARFYPSCILTVVLSMLILSGGYTNSSYAANQSPDWQPEASERLVKLPASYIKRSLEKDFSQSKLGVALKDIDIEISFKSQTLSDLQAAIENSEGEIKTDLQHQYLVEKRAYVDLVSDKIKLRRKSLDKKAQVLERLMSKMAKGEAAITPVRRELMEKQNAARTRFESSIPGVDIKLLEESMTGESKYSQQFATNFSAIDSLRRAIESHAMNKESEVDGVSMTREAYLRQMVTDVQTELELIGQEEVILGYMAKLVALDATALSNQFADVEVADSEIPDNVTLTGAVKFFITQ